MLGPVTCVVSLKRAFPAYTRCTTPPNVLRPPRLDSTWLAISTIGMVERIAHTAVQTTKAYLPATLLHAVREASVSVRK